MKGKRYRLYNRDCFEVFEKIPDGWIDMVMVDPPYGTTACKWDSIIPLEPMWRELKRVVKSNGAILIMASQPFTTILIASNIKEYKATWYWQKERGTNFVQAKRYPMRVIEDCLLFCKKTPLYNPKMREVKLYTHVLPKPKNGPSQHMDSCSKDAAGNRIYKNYTNAYPVNVLVIPRDNMVKNKSLHPTQKPVALMEYLIRTYTNEGDMVLDFAMGSGTTGVACGNLGRRFVGCDNDTEHGYFEIAEKRIRMAYERSRFGFGLKGLEA